MMTRLVINREDTTWAGGPPAAQPSLATNPSVQSGDETNRPARPVVYTNSTLSFKAPNKTAPSSLDQFIKTTAFSREDWSGIKKFLDIRVNGNNFKSKNAWNEAEKHLPGKIKCEFERLVDQEFTGYKSKPLSALERAVLMLDPLTGTIMMASDVVAVPLTSVAACLTDKSLVQALNILSFAILPLALAIGIGIEKYTADKKREIETRFLAGLKLLIAQQLFCNFLLSPENMIRLDNSRRPEFDGDPERNEPNKTTDKARLQKTVGSAKWEGIKAGIKVFVSIGVFLATGASTLHALHVQLAPALTSAFTSLPLAITVIAAAVLLLSAYYGYVYAKKMRQAKTSQKEFNLILETLPNKKERVSVAYQKEFGVRNTPVVSQAASSQSSSQDDLTNPAIAGVFSRSASPPVPTGNLIDLSDDVQEFNDAFLEPVLIPQPTH